MTLSTQPPQAVPRPTQVSQSISTVISFRRRLRLALRPVTRTVRATSGTLGGPSDRKSRALFARQRQVGQTRPLSPFGNQDLLTFVARPRTHSDEELLSRIASGLNEAPAHWSLTDAARAADVHPATLVKRFGSKHGLLVRLSHRWCASIPDGPRTGDPLAELHAWADTVGRTAPDQTQGMAGLAMLLEDLKDQELRRLLGTGWDRQAAYLGALVGAAREGRQLLRAPSPAVSGSILLDVLHGSYLRAAATKGTDRCVDARAQILTLLESWT